jgi:hypothetical protein
VMNTNTAINTFENNNFALVNEVLKNFDTPLKTSSKVCLQREELVALTGNDLQARILSQIIYRITHRHDLKEFLTEETRRRDKTSAGELYHGWIRLAAWELKKETLSTFCEETIRRHVLKLVKKGYLYERHDPVKYDRGKNYRLNLKTVVKHLYKLGYSLSGITVPNSLIPIIPHSVGYNPHYASSTPQFSGYIPYFVELNTECINNYCINTTTTTTEDINSEFIETCRERIPIPEPIPDSSQNLSSSIDIDNDDDDLIFDHALADISDAEKSELRILVKGSENAQELLDELNSAVVAGQVKKSRIGYLKVLVERNKKGLFNATSTLRETRQQSVTEVTTVSTETNSTGNAIKQCGLCDENGHIQLIDSRGIQTTTKCPHNRELIDRVNKARGYRLASEISEASTFPGSKKILSRQLERLIQKKKLN